MRSLMLALILSLPCCSSALALSLKAPSRSSGDTSADHSADPWPNSQHGTFLSTYDTTRIHESMARTGTLPSVSSQRRIAQWPHGGIFLELTLRRYGAFPTPQSRLSRQHRVR